MSEIIDFNWKRVFAKNFVDKYIEDPDFAAEYARTYMSFHGYELHAAQEQIQEEFRSRGYEVYPNG